MENLLTHHYKRGSNQYIKRYKKQPDRFWGLRFNHWILIYSLIGLLLLFYGLNYQAKQHQPGKFVSPLPQGASTYTWSTPPVTKHFEDKRAQKLYNFLNSMNSPLAPFADTMVHAADENALPYNLSAAIACQESSCGKILANSYNAWGITTGLGTGPRFQGFNSWKEAIYFHAHFLSKNYRSDMIGGIQNRYCPASDNCSRQWTVNVTMFSKEIAGDSAQMN